MKFEFPRRNVPKVKALPPFKTSHETNKSGRCPSLNRALPRIYTQLQFVNTETEPIESANPSIVDACMLFILGKVFTTQVRMTIKSPIKKPLTNNQMAKVFKHCITRDRIKWHCFYNKVLLWCGFHQVHHAKQDRTQQGHSNQSKPILELYNIFMPNSFHIHKIWKCYKMAKKTTNLKLHFYKDLLAYGRIVSQDTDKCQNSKFGANVISA